MKKNMNELFARVGQITATGLPMMEGKEKKEVATLFGEELTVSEYGFMEGDEGEYVVLTLKEYPENFIYGSTVVTQAFQKIDSEFTDEEKVAILECGLRFKLSEIMSKNKRKYTKIIFLPM